MKLYSPPIPKRVRALVAVLPRQQRIGQHGAFPADYPLLWVITDGTGVEETFAAYATAWAEDGELKLRGCQVAKKYRGRGLQKRLLRLRLRYARRHGLRPSTYVANDNAPSLVNVIRAGFIPTAVRDGFVVLEASK